MPKRSPHGPSEASLLDARVFEDLGGRACWDFFLAMKIDLDQPRKPVLTVKAFASILPPQLESMLAQESNELGKRHPQGKVQDQLRNGKARGGGRQSERQSFWRLPRFSPDEFLR
jgi:hypothetical protein